MKGHDKKKEFLPRHAAGSFELKEGTGAITAMCSCGSFLEIYKQDKTFRVRTPESIDPEVTNPNAPWVASPVSDVGSSNLIVARVLLQGEEILKAASLDNHVDKDAIRIYLHSCKESLLACEKLAERVSTSIDQIIQRITETGITLDNSNRGLNPFPQVQDLDTDCGSFLVHANRAIKMICELPQAFFSFDRADSNFDHLSKRFAATFGEKSALTKFVQDNTEGVRYLIDLRNFHEHPKQIRTIIENFRVLPDGRIQVPMWHIDGHMPAIPRPIKEEMYAGITFLRDMAEAMLIHLVMQQASTKFPYYIEEIPEKDINPLIPIKYILSIDFNRLKPF